MMIIKDINQWINLRQQINPSQIGFVPTMGCLHQGHASLLEKARAENKKTVLSIFVNPTQFNDKNDYLHYPKTLETDLKLAEQFNIDHVLIPEDKNIYPDGNLMPILADHPLANMLEGKYRPGHFNGVLTVVMKLLNLVAPTRAYFGEKDYQQYSLIKTMAQNYFIATNIIACPTIREPSGLPFSSRNKRLSVEEKKVADQFATIFHRCNSSTINETKTELINIGCDVDYLEYYANRIFVAVRIGQIRLIDNFSVCESNC